MAIIDVLMTDLFNNRRFVIPNYQRHYAWDKDQCQALLDDLDVINLLHTSHERFMGYITTLAPHSQPIMTTDFQALSERQVVDGQQRLTSLSLLIAAIARFFDKNGNPSLSSTLRDKYLIAKVPNGDLPLLLVQDLKAYAQPNQNGPVRELYLSLITGNKYKPNKKWPTIPAMTRMTEASRLFDVWLSKLNVTQAQELLIKIQTRIRFGLNEAGSIVHAGDMFEGLNNRGKPLSDLERIKSHAAYVASSLLPAGSSIALINGTTYMQADLVEESNEKIGDTYYALDRMDIGTPSYEIDLILAHHPTIAVELNTILAPIYQNPPYNGLLPITKEQPSDFFRNNLGLKKASSANAKKCLLDASIVYLNSLANAAPYYADVRKPDHQSAFETWNQKSDPYLGTIKYYSEALVSLRKSKHYAPILLAYRMRYPNQSSDYCKLAKGVETVAFWTVALKRGEFGLSAVNGIADKISSSNLNIDQCLTELYKRAAQSILNKASKKLQLDNDDIRDIIDNRNLKKICVAIKTVISEGEIDEDVYHHIIFEFWNNNAPGLFSSRSTVASAMNNDSYFFRVFRPRRGQPVQPQLNGSSSSDRGTWSSHVSNFVPAINKAQRDLVDNIGKEAVFSDLTNAGVDSKLILGGNLNVTAVQSLFDEFNSFIAQRWWPDVGLEYNCEQRLPDLFCVDMS